MVVDFFIAGVQKGGTTALDALLRMQPPISMARIKETHFFDDDSLDWADPDYEILHRQYVRQAGAVRGDATPIYSYWPCALERLARYNPRAKILLCLRHPSLRAHSHWRMETLRGNDSMPFSDAVREAGRKRVRLAPNRVHRIFSYVERGFYAPQARRIFSLFPRDQILFVRTDALWSEPHAVLSQVCNFLGVSIASASVERTYQVPIDSRELGSIAWEERAYLDGLYAEDIRETAALTGLNLDDWLDPSYSEPMQPAQHAPTGVARMHKLSSLRAED